MKRIVYYVATSLDGFISGKDGDVSGFTGKGNGVDQYLNDLKEYDTVIMGRKTYEFGYDYGLEPGQLAYPHMAHYIFSDSLILEKKDDALQIVNLDIEVIKKLKNQPGSDIYLCGGGQFAGWLLEHQQIDILKIKLNPLILGAGVPLFGESKVSCQLEFQDAGLYQHGLQIITYGINYEGQARAKN
ncbi:MAG: dihydrofolate reductase [Cyclobacteriaceae bacterium]|nr:MAG: dihydrofolate reductase [Cyclobacteriaceae bacterium]